jgi:tetratricopeptide (TPR) repeat protein
MRFFAYSGWLVWLLCSCAESPAERVGLPPHTAQLVQRAIQEAASGTPERALAMARQALDESERLPGGPQGPQTITPRLVYGYALVLTGRDAEALPILQRSTADASREFGKTHPNTLLGLGWQARALADLNEPERALPLYQEELNGRLATQGERHLDTMNAMLGVAVSLLQLSRDAEAKPYCEKLVRLRSEVEGEASPDAIFAAHDYGVVLMRLGQTREGARYLERAATLAATTFGAGDSRTRQLQGDFQGSQAQDPPAATPEPPPEKNP